MLDASVLIKSSPFLKYIDVKISSISGVKEVTPFPLKRKSQVALDICEYFSLY